MNIKTLLKKILLKPVYVKHCSQTIYEALLGCIRLYDYSNDVIWKKRSLELTKLLIEIQRPDGGFDIGYDFNFGMRHKKGDSTSPELVGLLALVESYKRFNGADIKDAAFRAAKWIKTRSIRLNDTHWAIPYSPYNTENIMVYNGTSFAVGALGVYLSEFPDSELEKVYKGMIRYLSDSMHSDEDRKGKFWYYSVQDRVDLTPEAKAKVDYYHQMQQVEMHAIAQKKSPNAIQEAMIEAATDHVLDQQRKDGSIPYLNTPQDIHVWGLCSCSSGFLLASDFIDSKSEMYQNAAKGVIEYIIDHSWNGRFFVPILGKDREIIDNNYYVRSDAWVFNALSLALSKKISPKVTLDICEKSFQKMADNNFSGGENHASSPTKRFVFWSIANVRKVLPATK